MSLVRLVEQLKKINQVIDATKGTLQLQILMLLHSKGPQDADEISKAMSKRRKAVTDALRKLRMKGLIDERPKSETDPESIYALTDQGREYVGSLNSLFNLSEHPSPEEEKRLVKFVEEFPLLYYTYDGVIALGLAGDDGLSAKELGRILNLSEQRAITYFDLFSSTPGATLFKKIDQGSGGRGGPGKVRYTLTEEGKRVFRLLPSYNKMRLSIPFKILRFITMATHPRQVYSRLAIITAIGSAVSLCATASAVLHPFTGIWLYFLVFLAGVISLEQLIPRLVK